MIIENLQTLQDRINTACRRSGRDPNEVQLLLATKTVSFEPITQALLAGYTLIGENKVQELRQKYDALQHLQPTHHFIGHLQTNKIKDILKYDIACIQSIDRYDLAYQLHQKLQLKNRTLAVFIQVNTSGETSKFGVRPEDVAAFIRQVAALSALQIKGLMTIGIQGSDEEKVRHCFQLLKQLQSEVAALNIPGVSIKELSMGMSNDLEIAVEEGATIVRVGTAIFGERKYPDSYYWDESR